MLKYLIAFIFFMHGMAHISGFIASWTKSSAGFADRPWLLRGNVKLTSTIGKVFGLLWLAAMVCLVATAYGLAFRQAWWTCTAIVGSLLSWVVILPWLKTVPPGAWAGAVFDLLVVAALLPPWRALVIQLIQ